jgi:hypothetical protein
MSLLTLLYPALDDDGTTVAETAYEPVRDDIARLLRARTFAKGGQRREFTDTTDPTRAQVDELIDDAASDVIAVVGSNLDATLHPAARRVVALGTTLLIEVGARDFDQARYDRLQKLYDTRLAQLDAADAATDPDDPGTGTGGGDGGGALFIGDPVGTFPCPVQLDW